MEQRVTSMWVRFVEWLYALVQHTCNPDIEEQASQTRSDDTEHDLKYIYDDDFKQFPIGWPRLARIQNYVHNGSIHRRFGALRQRCLLDDEVLLAQLEARLLRLDKIDEARNSPMLYSLSPAQTLDEFGDTQEGCEKDRVMANIKTVLRRYTQALRDDADTRKLHRIDSPAEFSSHRDTARALGILKSPAKEFLIAPHDFITTRPQRLHDSLERVIFGKESRWLMRLLSKKEKPKGSIYRFHLHQVWVRAVSAATLVFVGLTLLLLPIAILYFLEPVKGWSFAVVIVFSLAFTVGLAAVPTIRTEVVLMGLSAYVAVLVAFLANFQGGNCQCQRTV
ncbi:hypothetical protein VTK26DRAFT_6125 [Humicola hyalothermophila]